MMNKSTTLGALAGALAKAQAEMPAVPKGATNPFLKNKYATLDDTIAVVYPVLNRHGLTISQFPVNDGDSIGLTTILMHESGEWLEQTFVMPLADEKGKSMAQVAGSVFSYLRRYGISAVTGVATDDDADGNAPQTKQVKSAPAPAKQPAAPTPSPVEPGGNKHDLAKEFHRLGSAKYGAKWPVEGRKLMQSLVPDATTTDELSASNLQELIGLLK